MPQPQLLSSILCSRRSNVPPGRGAQAQMMLALIVVPAFSGTDLHTVECTLCNHVLKKLGACEDWRGPRRFGHHARKAQSILAADPFAPDGQQRRMITGPRNRPSNPNDCIPPRIPISTSRNGTRVSPPISAG
jgi:hypothetical protein